MQTQTLEELIRALAARGSLSHISLAMNSSGTKWRGTYAPAKTFGVSYAEDADPIKALILAMGAKPKSKNMNTAPALKQPDVEVTETVEDLM